MKIKNKISGEVVDVITDSIGIHTFTKGNEIIRFYSSIKDLNNNWEDYGG